MKKLFIIIALIISTLFLFSVNEVRAETLELIVPDTEFDYLTEDFYTFRESVVEYCNENNKKYIITSNFYTYGLTAYIYDEDTTGSSYNIENFNYPYGDFIAIRVNNPRVIIYSQPDTFSSNMTTSWTRVQFRLNSSSKTFSLYNYLDTNFDFIPYQSDVTNSFLITYQDLSYEVSNGTLPPTLYQIYMDSQDDSSDKPVVDDKFPEEREKMNMFYSTIFTKIGDLATIFATNYTFLLILGIMILIFVIELIRRYLL